MNIEEILKDEAFTAQLKAAESLDEVVRLCKAKDIKVTAAQLEAVMNAEDGELDEGALDNVAGGSLISWLISFITPSEKQMKKASKEWDKMFATINAAHSK